MSVEEESWRQTGATSPLDLRRLVVAKGTKAVGCPRSGTCGSPVSGTNSIVRVRPFSGRSIALEINGALSDRE
jgi:hypothetical protein